MLGLEERQAGRDWKEGTIEHLNGSLDSSAFHLAGGSGCESRGAVGWDLP